jgi:hypothetical protein
LAGAKASSAVSTGAGRDSRTPHGSSVRPVLGAPCWLATVRDFHHLAARPQAD